MTVELLCFADCPHWRAMAADLDAVTAELGLTFSVVLVETPDRAAELQFHGSPSLHIDGSDPFAAPRDRVGLTCRIYATPAGPAGSPGRPAIRRALLAAGGSTVV